MILLDIDLVCQNWKGSNTNSISIARAPKKRFSSD